MIQDYQSIVQTTAQNTAFMPVLATKLFTPTPPAPLIERPHLTHQLDNAIALRHPLTLIHTPAGFGKTSLLSAWAKEVSANDASNTKVTWFSVDENDNDPVRFWSYIIIALRDLLPGIGETALAALQSPQPQPVNAVVATLINDLAYATINQESAYILVIDDYHAINTPVIHESLAYFIKQLNALPVQLIIASRTEPALRIARLRARGQLTHISASALRFSLEECHRFLHRTIPTELTDMHIRILCERTEGWAAGLQLAALAIRSRLELDESQNTYPTLSGDPVSRFIDEFSGSNQYVLDYLGEEILRHQTPELRDFLFCTSVLEQFNADLCDAIRQQENSRQYLNILDKQSLFLIPLNQQRTWYRYHRLFGEFLRSRRQDHTFAPQSIPLKELHMRAGQWYAGAGQLPEAIHHAFEAQEQHHAAELIEAYRRRALVNGETSLLLSWLDRLPKSIIRSRPELALSKAWAMVVSGELAQVGPLLAAIPAQHSPEANVIIGEKAALTSLIATLMGDTETAIQNAHNAMDNLPDDDLFMRALIGINLGRAYDMVGDLHRSQPIYQDALDAAMQTDNILVAIMALCQLGDIAVVRGDLHTAAVKYQRAIRLAEQTGKLLPVLGLAYAAMGQLHYRWGEMELAEAHLNAAIDLGERWESTDILIISSIYAAQVQLASGNQREAIALIRQTEQALQGNIVSAPTVAAAEALLTRLYMRLGKTRAGTQWLNANPLQRENIAQDIYHLQVITRAQVLLAFDEPATVCTELSHGLDAMEFEGYLGYVLERAVMLATADAARGNLRAAMTYTQRALDIGAGDGDVYSFVEAGPHMRTLLQSAVQHGIQTEYAQHILGYFDAEPVGAPGATFTASDNSLPVYIEALSPREVEVLRQLAKGKANKEIARSLYIAPGTVKQHLKNIYGKLDVHNRTEAANRGRALQLI